MNKININSRDILSDKAYRLEEITFTKPGLDGAEHQQKNEIYFRPDAVSVLLVDRQNEHFILAKQFRLPAYLNPHDSTDGLLLEVCAGLIEDGEAPDQAVIREAKEETGYRIANPVKIGGIYTSAGGITEYLHLFIAEVNPADRKDVGGGTEGEGEDIELIRLTFGEAEQRLASGEINDAKTMMLLQHYFLYYQ